MQSKFSQTSKIRGTSPFEKVIVGLNKRLGTCALIMYLLGERSSPLHCGQNPLLSGCQEPAPSAPSGLLITLSRGRAFESPRSYRGIMLVNVKFCYKIQRFCKQTA
jgi:hypothetical protein